MLGLCAQKQAASNAAVELLILTISVPKLIDVNAGVSLMNLTQWWFFA